MNVGLGWKCLLSDKCSSLFGQSVKGREQKISNIDNNRSKIRRPRPNLKRSGGSLKPTWKDRNAQPRIQQQTRLKNADWPKTIAPNCRRLENRQHVVPSPKTSQENQRRRYWSRRRSTAYRLNRLIYRRWRPKCRLADWRWRWTPQKCLRSLIWNRILKFIKWVDFILCKSIIFLSRWLRLL